MSVRWRRELERIDEIDPPAEVFQRARAGSTSSARSGRRIDRTPRRAPLFVAVLAVLLFAGLSILAPQRLARAREFRSAGVGAVHATVVWLEPR